MKEFWTLHDLNREQHVNQQRDIHTVDPGVNPPSSSSAPAPARADKLFPLPPTRRTSCPLTCPLSSRGSTPLTLKSLLRRVRRALLCCRLPWLFPRRDWRRSSGTGEEQSGTEEEEEEEEGGQTSQPAVWLEEPAVSRKGGGSCVEGLWSLSCKHWSRVRGMWRETQGLYGCLSLSLLYNVVL